MASEPLPPTVEELLADRNAIYNRYPSNRFSSWRVSNQPRPLLSTLLRKPNPDTPSASFYRLYQFMVIDWNIQFRNELEYFCVFHPDWAVADIPDPQDPDPLRYALLAVLTKFMCESFNRRIELGLPRDAPPIIEDFEEMARRPKIYEHPPAWAERVPPLSETYYLPDHEGKTIEAGDEYMSEDLKEMNIIGKYPHMHFV